MILFSFQPDFIPIIKELKSYEITTMHPNFTKMLADIDINAKSLSDFMTRENYEFGNLIAAKKIAEYDRDYKQVGFTVSILSSERDISLKIVKVYAD